MSWRRSTFNEVNDWALILGTYYLTILMKCLYLLCIFQIILLTYGPQRDCLDLFNQLLAIWIPSRGEIPRAFMSQNPDIHNPQDPEVVLIPDWLKLKMIRSEVQIYFLVFWNRKKAKKPKKMSSFTNEKIIFFLFHSRYHHLWTQLWSS